MRPDAPGSPYHLDETDQEIIYALMDDARNKTPPVIAEEIDVSPGTVRNRIETLREHGVITGYHAQIDFEQTDTRLTTLFMCSVPFADRRTAARVAYEIPGVVNVRLLMGGRRNFHVLAVGENTADLRRIGTTLSEADIEIEDEMLVEDDETRPYAPFDSAFQERTSPREFAHIAGDNEVVELTAEPEAPITGNRIAEAAEVGLLEQDPLIVAVKRGEEMLTPHGETVIESGDVVTLFAVGGITDETVRSFVDQPAADTEVTDE